MLRSARSDQDRPPTVTGHITEQRSSFGSLLRRPYELLAKRLYAELTTHGFPDIRPAHGVVFRYLLPEGCRVTDLADCAHMTKQSMAYLVDYLTEHGYTTLVPDPTDGRAKLVLLTDRGTAVQEMLISLGLHVEAAMAQEFGPDDMHQLRTLLEKVRLFLEHP